MAHASDYTSKYLALVRYPDKPKWVWLQRKTAICLSPDFNSEEEAVKWIAEEMGENPYLEYEQQQRAKQNNIRDKLRRQRPEEDN